jgi:four helix bundle protein
MQSSFSFTDLRVWVESKDLCVQVIKALKDCRDFWFLGQISRSSISVPSNIAEWFERKWRWEFLQYLYIAKWSVSELQTQIIIGAELDYFTPEESKDFKEKSENVRRMLMSLISKEGANSKRKV